MPTWIKFFFNEKIFYETDGYVKISLLRQLKRGHFVVFRVFGNNPDLSAYAHLRVDM
jgi:hypothetical protein